jgi:glycosyltransferase involved in cell wall biosynthesis
MRVLRLCSVYGAASASIATGGFDAVGGMQVHTDRLTTALDARGVTQVVVTAYRPSAPRVEHPSARSRVVRVGVRIRRFRQLYGVAAVPTVARIGRVDLVHVHLGEDLAIVPLSRWAADRSGAPLVVTVHCHLGHTLVVHDARSAALRRFGAPMQARLLREADAVLVLSDLLAARLISSGIAPSRVRSVPLGIDLSARTYDRPSDMDDRRWVVFAGRLVREKGVDDLVAAFARVVAPDLGLLVVGDGPERGPLEATIRERGLGRAVRLVGAVPNAAVARYLQHASVVAVPSWFEERGRIVLEAMAVGAPVVATRVGGIPASVRDGVNGLLVPPRSPAELATAIDRVLGDRRLSAAIGAAGVVTARAHGTDALAEATLDAYRTVLGPVARGTDRGFARMP